jgi:hypothetical protein
MSTNTVIKRHKAGHLENEGTHYHVPEQYATSNEAIRDWEYAVIDEVNGKYDVVYYQHADECNVIELNW